MILTTISPDAYEQAVDPVYQQAFVMLRKTILSHIPDGFTEVMQYGMIWYVVPHSLYPAWYHCKPSEPLPFVWLAAQKNYLSLYHMWLYADSDLLHRFQTQYASSCPTKLNMGKSCIRFNASTQIPYDLIGELYTKYTVSQRIETYEQTQKK